MRIMATCADRPVPHAVGAIAVASGETLRWCTFAFQSALPAPGPSRLERNAKKLARFPGWWDRIFTSPAEHAVKKPARYAVVLGAGLPAAAGGR